MTFNKVMNTSTLNGSNITLTGPGGAVAVGQGSLVSGDTYSIPIHAAAGQRLVRAHDRHRRGSTGGNASRPLLYQSSFTVSLPDLVTSAVTPSATSAEFGATLSIGWTVTNQGTAGATGPWMDDVYLSPTQTLTASAIYLTSFTAESGGTLAAGASYAGQASVQIPFSSALTAGTNYVVVVADAGGVVNESDLTTQQAGAAITLSAAPPPDLAASDVTSSLTDGAARAVGDR